MCYDHSMPKRPEDISTDDVLGALVRQSEAVADERNRRILRELVVTLPVAKAAEQMHISETVAWRIIAADPEAQRALDEGDLVRHRMKLDQQRSYVGEALLVVRELMQDQEVDDKVRLAAAKDMLDRSNYFADPKQDNGSQAVVGVTLDFGGDDEFARRFQSVTVQAGAKTG